MPKLRPLFTGFRSAYLFVESHDGRLYFRTDDRAPLGRIIAVDPTADPAQTAEVVSEQRDKLSSVVLVHGTLVASYLHNASDQIRLFDPAGSPIGGIPLPEIGSAWELSGRGRDMSTTFSSDLRRSRRHRRVFVSDSPLVRPSSSGGPSFDSILRR